MLTGSHAIDANAVFYNVAEAGLGMGNLFFCALLFRTGLVPRLLAAWGFIGYACFAGGNLLELFGVSGAALVAAIPVDCSSGRSPSGSSPAGSPPPRPHRRPSTSILARHARRWHNRPAGDDRRRPVAGSVSVDDRTASGSIPREVTQSRTCT